MRVLSTSALSVLLIPRRSDKISVAAPHLQKPKHPLKNVMEVKPDNTLKLTYTKTEAAEVLNVPLSGIEWLLRKKSIRHRKITGKVRFTVADLAEVVEKSLVLPEISENSP